MSSTSNFTTPLTFPLTAETLAAINAHLKDLTPEDIIRWGMQHLPRLYQTTAFGLTGLVAIDMISKIIAEDSTLTRPPLIFIDTLYHFKETYALVDEVRQRYNVPVDIYRPEGCADVHEFESKHGERLWERDEEKYDYLVKVEPARRAYETLKVKAVITGRRASQGGARASLQPLEIDTTGLLKLNPLFAWPFTIVEWYVTENKVPRNALLDQGYRSVGDWHSTVPSTDERAGRWAGKEKTECGLHVDYFEMKKKARVDGTVQETTVAV